MARVVTSENTCMGYANCVSVAPRLFELDAAGLVLVRSDHLDNAGRDAAEQAVAECPTLTLRIED
jgi:ferredoxin